MAQGLRADSRCVMRFYGQKINPDRFLLMTICDELQIVMYQQRAIAGSKHNPKPRLMTERIRELQNQSKYESFDTPDEFNRRREQILKGG